MRTSRYNSFVYVSLQEATGEPFVTTVALKVSYDFYEGTRQWPDVEPVRCARVAAVVSSFSPTMNIAAYNAALDVDLHH